MLGAARELEQSLVSAQGSLQQLADQESLDDISEHGTCRQLNKI